MNPIKQILSNFWPVALLAVLLIGSQFIYRVTEIERGVLLRFGQLAESDIKPGLHFKVPIVNSVRKFDARIITLEPPEAEYLTIEKKALIVDYYVKWRIANVAKFYTATNGDETVANRILTARVDTTLRNQFGERTVFEVVSGERDLLIDEIIEELNTVAQQELGIEIIDVRIKKINLPRNVSNAVFERMTTERERLAQELRSQGREASEGIRADADKQKEIIEAEAYRDAEKIRGDGDAEAASIYAQAYSREPGFYEFYRTINAYRTVFSSSDDLLILEPDSEFLQMLQASEMR